MWMVRGCVWYLFCVISPTFFWTECLQILKNVLYIYTFVLWICAHIQIIFVDFPGGEIRQFSIALSIEGTHFVWSTINLFSQSLQTEKIFTFVKIFEKWICYSYISSPWFVSGCLLLYLSNCLALCPKYMLLAWNLEFPMLNSKVNCTFGRYTKWEEVDWFWCSLVKDQYHTTIKRNFSNKCSLNEILSFPSWKGHINCRNI